MMLPRRILILTLTSVVAFVANGQMNPYFVCNQSLTDSYNIILHPWDEIVFNNCTSFVTNETINQLQYSLMRKQPISIRPSTVIVNLTEIDYLANVTNFEYSLSGLSILDLRSMKRLEFLNLTYNKFRLLEAARLPDDITLISFDMSHNRIGVLKSATIPSTRKLYLRSNNIMQLDSNFILPSALEELDLTRNEIGDLSLTTFRSTTLKVLNLNINLINAISNTSFAHLPALQTLQLECNKIFDIEPQTFDQNGNLSYLNLRDNNLSTLRKGVLDNLVNLQALDVSKNRLLRFTPDDIQKLNNLVHLSLSENAKLCPDQSKGDLKFLLMLGNRLKVLKMSRLCLQYFPVTLTTSIRALDLSANNLTSVRTGDLENFPILEILDLSANELTVVEVDVFFRLEFLEVLYLQNNRLKRVPTQLPFSLRHLRLDENCITIIGRTDFHNLSKLSSLRLDSNAIKSIENEAYYPLGNLAFLDISHNPIRELNTDAFEGANNVETFQASGLRYVHLNATDLRFFPVSELPNLRFLNLSGSSDLAVAFLMDFPLLTTVKQLETLDMDDDDLKRIPSHLVSFLPRLKLLSLLGNPLDCDNEPAFHLWGKWYDSKFPSVDYNSTEVKVRITLRPISPVNNRTTIRSKCNFSSQITDSVISRNTFWSMVQLKLETTTLSATPSLLKRSKKLKSRSLIMSNTSKYFSTTQQTITKAIFDESRTHASSNSTTKLPTEVTSSASQSTTGGERGSFFDWFPSPNESAADRARVAGPDDVDRSSIQNHHPGILFFSSFVLISLALAIAPPCTMIHIYRRWCQHRRSQQHLDHQPNIEISSISAIVETEINLE